MSWPSCVSQVGCIFYFLARMIQLDETTWVPSLILAISCICILIQSLAGVRTGGAPSLFWSIPKSSINSVRSLSIQGSKLPSSAYNRQACLTSHDACEVRIAMALATSDFNCFLEAVESPFYHHRQKKLNHKIPIPPLLSLHLTPRTWLVSIHFE